MTTDVDAVQNQLCDRIEELEAEKMALIEENARLTDELRDRYSQTRCGCGHPACKRCRDDRDTEAVLQDKPTTSLAKLKAQWQAEVLQDLYNQYQGVGMIRRGVLLDKAIEAQQEAEELAND